MPDSRAAMAGKGQAGRGRVSGSSTGGSRRAKMAETPWRAWVGALLLEGRPAGLASECQGFSCIASVSKFQRVKEARETLCRALMSGDVTLNCGIMFAVPAGNPWDAQQGETQSARPVL